MGETLDFWRVEAVEPGHLLRLAAEMRVVAGMLRNIARAAVRGDCADPGRLPPPALPWANS